MVNGRTATEEEFQTVKKACRETWPDWRESDTPPIPRPRHKNQKGQGKGNGKGRGKGKGKGKGKGS
jgi:hypothetical protein